MRTAIAQVFEKHDNSFDKMKFLKWISKNRQKLILQESEIAEIYAGICMINTKEGRPFMKFKDFIELQNIDPNARGSYNSPM
jgi:hypothetical protein